MAYHWEPFEQENTANNTEKEKKSLLMNAEKFGYQYQDMKNG